MPEFKEKQPRKYPEEYPSYPEKYTQEFVAIDHIELSGPLELDEELGLRATDGEYGSRTAGESFSDCHRYKRPESQQQKEAHNARVRQDSDYHSGNKAAPDNNLFFEEQSNPLSSKGN